MIRDEQLVMVVVVVRGGGKKPHGNLLDTQFIQGKGLVQQILLLLPLLLLLTRRASISKGFGLKVSIQEC